VRAAVIDRFGGPSELHHAELEDPSVKAGQVRIGVSAAAVGRPGAITRAGVLTIRVAEVLPLSQAAHGHELFDDQAIRGRIVLAMR